MKYLVLVLSLVLIACTNVDDTTMQDDNMMDDTDNTENSAEADKTFVLTGENFAFFMDGEEAPELVVNQGDTVRIIFTSTDGYHDWVLDEFDAATEKVQTGDSTYVEFVADQVGTFEYYCSVGSHRANGMFGNLVVQ